MDVSIFLAKLIGLYFIIIGALCILRKRQMAMTGKELVSSKSALVVSAKISLLFGLVIAIDHTIWEYSWRGLITALGYLMILRGVMRYAFPNEVKKMASKIPDEGYVLMSLIVLAIGIYLTYCGFNY
ncbi:MAG: hypothetical protein JSS10_01735 [Verrucomicrobia bacterium]|nr:hypothetical protein [Verrucomicrobiota bacterium]